jgi:hypothetical protein
MINSHTLHIRNCLFSLGILLFFTLIPIFSTQTPTITAIQISVATLNTHQAAPDMLIFLSPQYANDNDLHTALTMFITSVHNDIQWNTTLIALSPQNNTFQTIDQLIEDTYKQHPLKACIMVGEDLDTPLSGGHGTIRRPSTVPWYTVGGETRYDRTNNTIIAKPYLMSVCIALLYPPSTLPYETKKTQLIDAFTKFTQRYHPYTNEITVLESSEFTSISKPLYQHLDTCGHLSYLTDPTERQLHATLQNPSSLYLVHGHSNPSGTSLNADHTLWFSAETVDTVHAPLFAADGCYVNGWWSTQPSTTTLATSNDQPWYGSKIFTNPTIDVMILGLLSQTGYSYPVSFVENAAPSLLHGATLAESMIGHTYIGDNVIIYGDPTFHFTIE